MIVQHIEQTYQYSISYLKAWRTKQKMFEMRFGTYEASYDNLPRMSSQVAARNPRRFYDTYLVPAMTRGQIILKRAFFCLGACVRAFQCCIPVVVGFWGYPQPGGGTHPSIPSRESTRGSAKRLCRSSLGAIAQELTDLEWFGPLERNTLHPLCDVLLLV